jgi:coiled-coil domain-containing protein 63/114
MGEIAKLKNAINLLRQEKTMYQNNLKSLETDIEKADGEINSLMQNIESSQNTSKMSQNMMLSLKMKNEEDKTNYYRRLTELNKELKDPKLNRGSRIKTGEINAIQNDTAAVLKHRLTKLIVNNKEKVKLIDNYQRNMKVIDEAFTTIKEATGLTDILEIQNTFIKGEEQNYNLLTYVDVLNQEIDNLVDINQNLRAKNEQLKKDNEEKQKILNDTPEDEKRRIKIQEYVDKKKKEVDEFQKMLDEISPLVKEVLVKLAGSKFNRNNPHRVQEYLNSGVNLNDSNLAEYLSELEEYTNSILIYKGKANKQSNSEIYAKTLLLDELAPKEFKKKTYVTLPLCRITPFCRTCSRTSAIRPRASRSCSTASSSRTSPRRIWRPSVRPMPPRPRRNDIPPE